ncbi:MAG: hypothetical protein IJ363_10720 [Clostridia bacterium]|nr:hypothetical protein [Clostridia bacterium]
MDVALSLLADGGRGGIGRLVLYGDVGGLGPDGLGLLFLGWLGCLLGIGLFSVLFQLGVFSFGGLVLVREKAAVMFVILVNDDSLIIL